MALGNGLGEPLALNYLLRAEAVMTVVSGSFWWRVPVPVPRLRSFVCVTLLLPVSCCIYKLYCCLIDKLDTPIILAWFFLRMSSLWVSAAFSCMCWAVCALPAVWAAESSTLFLLLEGKLVGLTFFAWPRPEWTGRTPLPIVVAP